MKVAAALQLRLIHVVDDNLPIKFTQSCNDAHATCVYMYVCMCVYNMCVKVTTIFLEVITGELQASGPRALAVISPDRFKRSGAYICIYIYIFFLRQHLVGARYFQRTAIIRG